MCEPIDRGLCDGHGFVDRCVSSGSDANLDFRRPAIGIFLSLERLNMSFAGAIGIADDPGFPRFA